MNNIDTCLCNITLLINQPASLPIFCHPLIYNLSSSLKSFLLIDADQWKYKLNPFYQKIEPAYFKILDHRLLHVLNGWALNQIFVLGICTQLFSGQKRNLKLIQKNLLRFIISVLIHRKHNNSWKILLYL